MPAETNLIEPKQGQVHKFHSRAVGRAGIPGMNGDTFSIKATKNVLRSLLPL